MAPVAETTSGRVAGIAGDGVTAFLGIRYGAPTGGEARFRPPLPAEPWSGVAEATSYGPACPPTLTAADRAYFPTSPLWTTYAGYDSGAGLSEDCLHLNVWTPALDAARRPVLVWLHGGGFAWGSNASTLTAGDALARGHDVVVVSPSHRLGILGFLHLAEVVGPAWEGSGVAGLLDLRLALEWIRDNIAAFGGDPGNVTLAGHSGGGAKVACLLALPSARGLFHRAVIQSGPVLLRTVDADEANETARQVLATVRGVHSLRELPVDELTRLCTERRFRPAVDGTWLPGHPFDPVAAPAAAGVPLLIGTTHRDTATFKFDSDPAFATLDDAGLRERVAHHPAAALGEAADAAVAAFAEREPDASDPELLVAITSAVLRADTETVIERKLAGSSAPVYVYAFTYDVPMPAGTAFPGAPMSPHGAELPFVFGLAGRTELAGDRPERLELAAEMSTRWAAFARAGVPGEGWPAYELVGRPTMVFGDEVRLEHDPYREERLLLEGARAAHPVS